MNKHIALVKKWVADHDSVTTEELHKNHLEAYAAYKDTSIFDAAEYATIYALFTAYWLSRYEALFLEEL